MTKNNDNKEILYPIRTVAAITGVNPVTLRAWESRYGLVRPRRTAKGHRLYSNREIDVINETLALLDKGVAISQNLSATGPRRGKNRCANQRSHR